MVLPVYHGGTEGHGGSKDFGGVLLTTSFLRAASVPLRASAVNRQRCRPPTTYPSTRTSTARSAARTLCVSAPIETKSAPASA